jgi:Flp pilus assembly protein TadG
MRPIIHNKAQRRGAVIPLFAILLIPLLGMLAFSIDLGYIVLVKTDLQTAADAAALAGSEKLQELYVQYTLPGQTAQDAILTMATTNTAGSPMATAEAFASYNKAGNVFIKVRDEDVTFSFSGTQADCQAKYGSGNRAFPNSITVVTRRDSIQNGPVSLFFGRLFGFATKELQATATATIYSGDVTSLQVIPGVNAHILPVALDMNIWNTFVSTGLSPDGMTHLATNGSPQLQVYPSGPYQGAFGLVDVGAPANNVPAFRTWIDGGETPNDISYLVNNNLLPVSPTSPKSWKDGPGLKSTLLSDFQGEMGVPNLIPLFMPYAAPSGWQAQSVGTYQPTNNSGGGGQNQTYAIVGFVGVTISQADGNGNNMNISVQPYCVVDPTAVILNPAPVGTQSSQFGCATTTFISAKLTR